MALRLSVLRDRCHVCTVPAVSGHRRHEQDVLMNRTEGRWLLVASDDAVERHDWQDTCRIASSVPLTEHASHVGRLSVMPDFCETRSRVLAEEISQSSDVKDFVRTATESDHDCRMCLRRYS